jgi:hypothetical protein
MDLGKKNKNEIFHFKLKTVSLYLYLLKIIEDIIMALPIRGIPVLEGEVARRFIKEAKENEKKRGSIKITQAQKDAYNALNADYKAQLAAGNIR